MLKLTEVLDEEFWEQISGLSPAKKLEAIKESEKIPIQIVEQKKHYYKGSPHSLSFGFEIEFKEVDKPKGDITYITHLREAFKVDGEAKERLDVNIGDGKIITISTDKYSAECDVIRIYEDRSVGYELVTRPFYINEIECKMKPIYEKIRTVLTPDFKTFWAGGHVTMMEGNHMNKPLNSLVVINMIQLSRAFYVPLLFLGSQNSYIRKTRYQALPPKAASVEVLNNTKYNIFNKKIMDNEIVGLEARFFSSPDSWQTAENNANILLALWRTAEKISKTGCKIMIKQSVFDDNNKIYKKYRDVDSNIFKSKLMSEYPFIYPSIKTFLSLIETEAIKSGVFDEIKRRLCLTNEKGSDLDVSDTIIDSIIRDSLIMTIKGSKREDIVTELKKKYKTVSRTFINRLI